MRITATIEGYEVTGSIYAGVVTLWCNAFDEGRQKFTDPDKLEAAIKAYDLSLRKNFTNRTAYTVGYGPNRKFVAAVKVTSLEKDGKSAWITGSARNTACLRSTGSTLRPGSSASHEPHLLAPRPPTEAAEGAADFRGVRR
jgi:hypothetical protein